METASPRLVIHPRPTPSGSRVGPSLAHSLVRNAASGSHSGSVTALPRRRTDWTSPIVAPQSPNAGPTKSQTPQSPFVVVAFAPEQESGPASPLFVSPSNSVHSLSAASSSASAANVPLLGPQTSYGHAPTPSSARSVGLSRMPSLGPALSPDLSRAPSLTTPDLSRAPSTNEPLPPPALILDQEQRLHVNLRGGPAAPGLTPTSSSMAPSSPSVADWLVAAPPAPSPISSDSSIPMPRVELVQLAPPHATPTPAAVPVAAFSRRERDGLRVVTTRTAYVSPSKAPIPAPAEPVPVLEPTPPEIELVVAPEHVELEHVEVEVSLRTQQGEEGQPQPTTTNTTTTKPILRSSSADLAVELVPLTLDVNTDDSRPMTPTPLNPMNAGSGPGVGKSPSPGAESSTDSTTNGSGTEGTIAAKMSPREALLVSPRGSRRLNGSGTFLSNGAPVAQTPPSSHRGIGSLRRQPTAVTFQSAANDLDDFNEEEHLPPLAQHFAPPKQWLFLHPHSTFKTVWSTLLILLITYSLFEVPMSIGFGYTATVWLKVVAYFIDAFFVGDVVANFFTGYLDEQMDLVHDPKLIATTYLKGWFLIDTLGSIPFDLIALATTQSSSGTKVFFVLRALKIPRLFRMVKLTAVLDIRSHRYLREVIRMVKLVLIMVVLGHWIACGFMLTARSESDITKTWANPVSDSDLGTQYVFALYWSLTVLSTVGFGDIVPLTQTEMIYTCVVMLMGAILYAVVVGNVMLVVANLNAPSQRHTEEIMKLDGYMRYRKFPPPLMKKVIDFTEAEWKRMRGYNEREVMAHLPESLQTEIARHLHAKMLQSVGMFKDSHSGFINSVVLAFHTAMLLPNTIMIRRNAVGDRCFLVSKGSVELIDRGQVYAVLQEGSFIGESALLDGIYRVTARTSTYCELCILYRSDFDRIVKNYPQFVDIVAAEAEKTTIMASKKDKLKALFS